MESRTFSCVTSLFYLEKDDPISMESRLSSSETEGEGGPFLVRYDMFFFLDSQVVRLFCSKECLTTLRVVILKPRENSNFLKNCKMVISVKIRNFSRSRMTKRTLSLESSREI